MRAMCALLSEQGAGVALRIAPCRRSSALTAVGAWEVRVVVELGMLPMYGISQGKARTELRGALYRTRTSYNYKTGKKTC